MLGNRLQGIRLLKLLITLALTLLLFWAWYGLFFLIVSQSYPTPGLYGVYSLVALMGIVLERSIRGNSLSLAPAYQSRDRSFEITLRETLAAATGIFVIAFITKDKAVSRAFILSYMALLPAVLLGVNHLILPRLSRQVFSGKRRLRTVLIGDQPEIASNLEWFRGQESLGMEIIGYIGNGSQTSPIEGIPYLGAQSELEETLSRTAPETAVFLDFPHASQDLIEKKAIGDRLGIRVVHLWNYKDHFDTLPAVHTEAGFQFMSFLSEPLESPVNRSIKRCFDVAFSLPVCLFILPPMSLAVWLLHRFQSPGSLFFLQTRRGRGGRPFRIIKFRTMHEGNPDESRQAEREDDRVFAAGRILRKLSIDEFPQFLNVLIGHMSVVGPRPHLGEHDDTFATVYNGYRLRTFVKPGVTGLAQVRGFRGLVQNEEEVRKRAGSDIEYVERWSLTLDITIILRTFILFLFPSRNAH